MATAIKRHGFWGVDWYDLDGHRRFRRVGDGTNEAAAKLEARRLTREMRAIREDNSVPHTASIEHVLTEWWQATITARHSPRTVERYECVIKRWREWLVNHERRKFYCITKADVEAYRNERLNVAAPKTVWNEMTVIKSVFKWATENGYCKENPTLAVTKIGGTKSNPMRLPDKLPQHFTDAEMQKILTAAYGTARLYLMLCLGRYMGFRTGGVLGLRAQDVDLVAGKIAVKEKGGKRRVIPIPEPLRAALDRYPAVEADGLWFGELTRGQYVETCKELCAFVRAASGRKNGRFHDLRHTFAINLLRAGVNIVVVSKLLGHADVKTTMVYLRIEDQDLERAMATVAAIPVTVPVEGIAPPVESADRSSA